MHCKSIFLSLFRFLICCFLCCPLFLGGCAKKADGAHVTSKAQSRQNEVIVYAYDSFVAEWGAGDPISAAFTKKTGYQVTLISAGDAAQVLTKAMLEKDAPYADVLIGMDNQMMQKAAGSGVLAEYDSPQKTLMVPAVTASATSPFLTPYDYSHFAFVYDTNSTVPAPESIRDLTKSVYRNKIIIMDPRTSTPGLGFVTWTRAVLGGGAEFDGYWRALKPNILTMAPSWDTGYGLFTSGEAPLCLSYMTDEPYHRFCEGEESHYAALIFAEGHPIQVEFCGVVRGAPNEAGAQAFVDFLTSEEAQRLLPETQWMYPVNRNVTLPDCYAHTTPPAKTVTCTEAELDDAVTRMLAIMAE